MNTAQKCTYAVYTVCIYSTGLYAHWYSRTQYRASVKPFWWCVVCIRFAPFCVFCHENVWISGGYLAVKVFTIVFCKITHI